jgi:DNA polymerase III subunit delta'
MIFKWQLAQLQHIMHAEANLPHALLLSGRAGIGKHAFALSLSKALLCKNRSAQHLACEECASCHWFSEGGHPDFRLIEPEDAESTDETPKKKTAKKRQISVAQIRQLIDYLSLTGHQVNSNRVILISPAEVLNSASANALLKMLEEPPANTLFLLVTSQPQRLLPTITSRCQIINMPLPIRSDAIAWLQAQHASNAEAALDYAGGAPLLALGLAEEGDVNAALIKNLALGAKLDPFASAPIFLGIGMERAIDALQKWVFDLIAFKLAQVLRYHLSHDNAFQVLSKSVNLKLLLSFQDKLINAKKTSDHPLSNELQLENILLQYTQLFKSI